MPGAAQVPGDRGQHRVREEIAKALIRWGGQPSDLPERDRSRSAHGPELPCCPNLPVSVSSSQFQPAVMPAGTQSGRKASAAPAARMTGRFG